jgi:hypothetical protein
VKARTRLLKSALSVLSILAVVGTGLLIGEPARAATSTCLGMNAVTGTVTDAVTTQPIAGATVSPSVPGGTGWLTTDASGVYCWIPPVTVATSATLTFSKAGYADASNSASLTVSTGVTLDVAMSPAPPTTYSVSGTLTDACNATIAGASVTLTVGAATTQATTDATGGYSFSGVADLANYGLSAPELDPSAGTTGSVAGANATTDLRLGAGCQVRGTVTDSVTTQPIAGATVSALWGGNPDGTPATTAGTGAFLMLLTQPRVNYTLTYSAAGYGNAVSVPFDFSAVTGPVLNSDGLTPVSLDAALTPAVVPPATSAVSGNVRDPYGAVSGATVEAYECLDGCGYLALTATASASTNSDGGYSFNLPVGEFALVATYNLETATRPNVVVDGVTDQTVDLAFGSTISGRVTSGDSLVPGASVQAMSAGSAVGLPAITDADGNYSLVVPAGVYDIVVTAPHYQESTTPAVDASLGDVPMSISLTPAPSIYGSVTIAGVAPVTAVAGAPVRVYEALLVGDAWTKGAQVGPTLTTDADGQYWSDALVPATTYIVEVMAAGYADSSTSVWVNPDSWAVADFAVDPVTESNGHSYRVVNCPGGCDWGLARAAALGSTYQGASGYLANVTTDAENSFIAGLAASFSTSPYGVYIGAYDEGTEGDWLWADGPEAGTLFFQGQRDDQGTWLGGQGAIAGAYNNWGAHQPDDYFVSNGALQEDWGVLVTTNAVAFVSPGQWNDQGAADPANSYVVEYDTVATVVPGGSSGGGGIADEPTTPVLLGGPIQPGGPTGVTAVSLATTPNKDGEPIQPIQPFTPGAGQTCSISPELPLGVTMDPTTCTISGMPLVTSPPTEYTVRLLDASGNVVDTKAIMFAVANGPSADSKIAKPGVPTTLGPIKVGTSTVTVSLPAGAYGRVLLYSKPTKCAYEYQGAKDNCSTVTLDMVSKSKSGKNLYSDKKPVRVVITCTDANCPQVGGSFNKLAEYRQYPQKVSMKENGAYLPFRLAQPCQPLSNTTSTGTINTATTKRLGFCMDVNAFSRKGKGLQRTVLFVEDPRFLAVSR